MNLRTRLALLSSLQCRISPHLGIPGQWVQIRILTVGGSATVKHTLLGLHFRAMVSVTHYQEPRACIVPLDLCTPFPRFAKDNGMEWYSNPFRVLFCSEANNA